MKKLLLFSLVIGCAFISRAQTKNQYHPNQTKERLLEKNFYLFSAMEENTELLKLLKADGQLKTYWDKMMAPLESTPKNGKEIIAPFLWSESDIQTVGKRLVDLSKDNDGLKSLIRKLRESNRYANFEKAPDDEYFYKIWEQCAKGLDTVLEVYGAGKMPFYRNIDSVSFDAKSKRYLYAVSILRTEAVEDAREEQVFFQPSVNLALNLLYANHKDEAVRYDPLDKKENAKAVQAIKNTDFKAYPYASIVVLGGGPENYRDKLSIAGKINLQLAMKEYRAKKAPFIIVSGGHVHPYMTPYCEAVEMKQELMEEYSVPEENIIIEPYARHTTTNMRNATRLMVDYGIPLDQKSLVVTNPSHSDYTGSETFTKRCQEELGYQPVDIHARLSPTTLEFTGNIVSFHQNPNQPLDP
ncbi:YdcF family protein [Muricauda sp. 334s03]|uniref:YdcF family protein n=1 Tax=Flagellimonas yonaguniensis TaxID=3031325 RepID=A0ABT5XW20_9FLAO|nr:YdcF family protein [[Muricauda] yonaguniensis]MDF0715387.1 YdcF family protein [[Muricauda] yonaguniensis]